MVLLGLIGCSARFTSHLRIVVVVRVDTGTTFENKSKTVNPTYCVPHLPSEKQHYYHTKQLAKDLKNFIQPEQC